MNREEMKLDSCPFCGGEVEMNRMAIRCLNVAGPACGAIVQFPICSVTTHAARLWNARAALRASAAPEEGKRVQGATDIVDEAACLIFAELCPGMVMGDDDYPHYEAAAKAVLALSPDSRKAEPVAWRDLLKQIREHSQRAEIRIDGSLSSTDWFPKRSHMEGVRNDFNTIIQRIDAALAPATEDGGREAVARRMFEKAEQGSWIHARSDEQQYWLELADAVLSPSPSVGTPEMSSAPPVHWDGDAGLGP